jgi:hypothetical protein
MFQNNLLLLMFPTSNVDFCEVKIGSVVASVYEDGKWYLGMVLSKDYINIEINIHFFKPAGEEAKDSNCHTKTAQRQFL